jgi:hypothetical protein
VQDIFDSLLDLKEEYSSFDIRFRTLDLSCLLKDIRISRVYKRDDVIDSFVREFEERIGEYKHYFSGKEFEKYPFWIAHYATSDLNEKTTTWHFWQHSEAGKVNGIRGGVDFNVFNGNYDQLLDLCKK